MRLQLHPGLLMGCALIASCDNATSPRQTSTTLSFCNSVQWVGMMNEGSGWKTIHSGGPAEVTRGATERVAIARFTPGDIPQPEVVFLTRSHGANTLHCAVA